MILLNPLALLTVGAVALAAIAALRRPARRRAVVSSLRLWRQAIEGMAPAERRKQVLSLHWLALTIGALLVALALARPALRSDRPRRYVALAVVPSAELLNPPGPERIRAAAERVLRQLSPDDRVQVLSPRHLAPDAAAWLSPAQARRLLASLGPIPRPAGEMTLPPADPRAQALYRIYPSGMDLQPSARAVDLPVAPTVPSVTLDALAAERLEDGRTQVLVAVRNHAEEPVETTVELDAAGHVIASQPLAIPAHGRAAAVLEVSAMVETLQARVGGAAGQSAQLLAQEVPSLRVALLGADEPDLRRFVAALPGAVAVADASAADVVISVGTPLPPGLPGVVFDPPAAPPGWRRATEPVGPVLLRDAAVRTQEHAELLEAVDLARVAVREARPFVPTPLASGSPVVEVPAGALVVSIEADRTVHIAFPPSPLLTNWPLDESFPILLANALQWAAGRPAERRWELSPDTAGLVGLAAGEAPPAVPGILIPDPVAAGEVVELWPALAAAGVALWVVGWYLRVRLPRSLRGNGAPRESS